MAILVQSSNGCWEYRSFEGGGKSGKGTGLKPKAFKTFEEAKNYIKEQGYDRWLRFNTSKEQEAKIVDHIDKSYGQGSNAKYDLKSNNCTNVVVNGLNAADVLDSNQNDLIKGRDTLVPNEVFESLKATKQDHDSGRINFLPDN